jgi:hypothetical protein
MKIAEAMAQETVTLNAGDFLAANTQSVGYLPTYKDNSDLHLGKYLHKVVSVGNELHVVRMLLAEDMESYVEEKGRPVITIGEGRISYMTTRNDLDFKDVYRAPRAHVVEGIPAGEEGRHALAAFLAYAASEYSAGVLDWQLTGPEFLDTTEEEPPVTEDPATDGGTTE